MNEFDKELNELDQIGYLMYEFYQDGISDLAHYKDFKEYVSQGIMRLNYLNVHKHEILDKKVRDFANTTRIRFRFWELHIRINMFLWQAILDDKGTLITTNKKFEKINEIFDGLVDLADLVEYETIEQEKTKFYQEQCKYYNQIGTGKKTGPTGLRF